jgi:aspartate kinase
MLNKGAGFTLKLMEILQKHHVSYEHMPSGIDDITIIFKKDVLTDQLIDVICNEIQTSLNPDQMQWIDDYAITMVVGEGMKDKLTLCASLLYPLGKKNISIQMINQGASQISIMIGTRRQDEEVVIKTIYDNFIAQDKI